jgi:hypothetical protein
LAAYYAAADEFDRKGCEGESDGMEGFAKAGMGRVA